MIKKWIGLLTALMLSATALNAVCAKKQKITDFSLLQLNLWVECTKVSDAPNYLVEQIATLQPDVATFCELYKGPEDNPVIPFLIKQLKAKGLLYYDARIEGRAVISKYPISETQRINQWMFKAVLDVDGTRVAVYPAHSEYRYYSCYYPRGYNDGSQNWNRLPAPITNVDTILTVCNRSDRVASMQAFIDNAKEEVQHGGLILMAGDLNEPSCLDWTDATKNLFEHRGCVVNWSASALLLQAGFRDAYRTKYPNAVRYPGFTFPADNAAATPQQLSWAIEADERERIDFVYYHPDKRIRVKAAQIVGPRGCIVRGERLTEFSRDPFVLPVNNHWPSDHKGVFVTFRIRH